MAGGTFTGGRAEGPSYGRTWSKMAGGAHVAKWTDYVSDYAFRGRPALRATSFESCATAGSWILVSSSDRLVL